MAIGWDAEPGTVNRRLVLALLGIITVLGVHLGVHFLISSLRAARYGELQNAIERQSELASLDRRWSALEQEIQLIAAAVAGAPDGEVREESRAGFSASLDAGLAQLGASDLSGPADGLAEPASALADSWRRTFAQLQRDPVEAIAELSLRSAPLAQELLRQRIPALEAREEERVAELSSEFRRFDRTSSVVLMMVFLAAVGVASWIAYWVSRSLVALNRGLEERVVERTAELKQEVHEHAATAEELRASRERYALASRGSNDGLWDWDLHEDRVYLSSRWKRMLGYEESDIGDQLDEWLLRVHPDDGHGLEQAIAQHLAGNSGHFEHEHRQRARDGTYRWVLSRGMVIRDANGAPMRMAGSMTDVTARRHVQEQMIHNATHDQLTGLPNRATLKEHIALSIARAHRSKASFAVLFLDLDDFKVVNDSLGHLIGDELLVALARRLEASRRPGDTVARLGGDEFAILLHDVATAAEVQTMTHRIQAALATPFFISGYEIYSNASIGVVLSNARYSAPDELLRDADSAMYRAKKTGRAGCEFFDEEMHEQVLSRLRTETALRKALENEELYFCFQPIVRLSDGAIESVEALIRWRHPQGRWIGPSTFIPLAEETGMIIPMAQWAFRKVCAQIREWDDTLGREWAPPRVSVNLSVREFGRQDLVKEVMETLAEYRIEPSRLIFEVTESAIIDHPEAARETLQKLRDLRFGLSLDDFGTGYSSLSALHDFPIETIKIDRSFVTQMTSGVADRQLVDAILSIGRQLHVSVIAEGVETEAQVRRLRELDCQSAQGFYFHKPLSPGGVTELMARRRGLIPLTEGVRLGAGEATGRPAGLILPRPLNHIVGRTHRIQVNPAVRATGIQVGQEGSDTT